VKAKGSLDAYDSPCYRLRQFPRPKRIGTGGGDDGSPGQVWRGQEHGKWRFKDFLLRGNLIDLAVAFVVGAAFTGLVQSFVKDLITPLIGIPGKFSFPSWTFTIRDSVFQIGDFFNALISFLILAFVLFLFVVRPMTAILAEIKKHEKQDTPDTRNCPFCLNKIPLKATRCGFCTSEVEAVAAATLAAQPEKQ
jgi:large conductance mechanosensitive channel